MNADANRRRAKQAKAASASPAKSASVRQKKGGSGSAASRGPAPNPRKPRGTGRAAPNQFSARASIEAARTAHLVACPDELFGLPPASLPDVPDSLQGMRSNLLVTSNQSDLVFTTHNKLVVGAGQHCVGAIVTGLWDFPVGASVALGDIVLINVGNSLGFFNRTGSESLDQRIVPRSDFVHAFMISGNTADQQVEPPTPAARRLKGFGIIGEAATNVWWADQNGNLVSFDLFPGFDSYGMSDLDVVLIGYCGGYSNATGFSITASPISAGGTQPLDNIRWQSIKPTNGTDVLSLATDPEVTPTSLYGNVGGFELYPYREVSTDVKIVNNASTLANGFTAVGYRMPGKGPRSLGSRMGTVDLRAFRSVTTPAGAAAAALTLRLFPTDEQLNAAALQVNLEYLRVTDPAHSGINVASRMEAVSEEHDGLYPDLATTACATANTKTISHADGDGGATWTPSEDRGVFPSQYALVHIDGSLSGTGDTTTPLSTRAVTWLNVMVPPTSGLNARRALYDPAFPQLLASLATLPAICSKDSWKDFWGDLKRTVSKAASTAYSSAKSVARDLGHQALAAGAGIARSVAQDAFADLALAALAI